MKNAHNADIRYKYWHISLPVEYENGRLWVDLKSFEVSLLLEFPPYFPFCLQALIWMKFICFNNEFSLKLLPFEHCVNNISYKN